MQLYEFFIEPFTEFGFMRKAFMACISLSIGCCPIGVLLMLRKMSLLGDALSHSVLPGVAIGYILAGMSLPIMGIGGVIAGSLIAFVATIVSRKTILCEDSSFIGFYLIALSFGTVLVSAFGSNVDLLNILFGQLLSVTSKSLIFITAITSLSTVVLSIIYRPLIIECFDPVFMRSIGANGSLYHIIFMLLVVINMVSAFQILGTLMSLGIMMLPAVSSRLWGNSVWQMFLLSCVIAILVSYLGLLISFHFKLPSGPLIVLLCGVIYVLSVLFGKYGSLYKRIVN